MSNCPRGISVLPSHPILEVNEGSHRYKVVEIHIGEGVLSFHVGHHLAKLLVIVVLLSLLVIIPVIEVEWRSHTVSGLGSPGKLLITSRFEPNLGNESD
jgi:hypothetical protein